MNKVGKRRDHQRLELPVLVIELERTNNRKAEQIREFVGGVGAQNR